MSFRDDLGRLEKETSQTLSTIPYILSPITMAPLEVNSCVRPRAEELSR